MNVKELMMATPSEAIAQDIVSRHHYALDADKKVKAIQIYADFIRSLFALTPVSSGYTLVGIWYVCGGKDELRACLYRKGALAVWQVPVLPAIEAVGALSNGEVAQMLEAIKLPESYAFELTPWAEILGYEVAVENVHEIGASTLCGEIVWEMTFFGLSEANVEKQRRELDRSIAELEAVRKLPPEEQEKHYRSAEEVFAELGWQDTRTEAEKEHERLTMSREMLENDLRTIQALVRYGLR